VAAEPSTTTAVGSLLNGNYLLERVIAEGGMGVVYEASHLRLPRKFAVKVLTRPKDAKLGDAATALARFRREAEIASTLAHPHIVEVFDFQVSEGGSPYLVMELLDGEDLADRLKGHGRMPVTAALRVIEEIAQALDVAHTAGVVHRDLKPANIFLSKRAGRDDFVKVLDFGVSKLIDSATLTQEKAMVGTPLYMSPEQAVGTQELTPESDVFSLGAIAYEILTGRRAFAASSIPSILYQIVHGPTPTLTGKAPGLGPEVDEVFGKVLAKKKQDRFACSTAFALALRRALEKPDSGPIRTSYLADDDSVPTDERLRRLPTGAGLSTGDAGQTDVDQSTKAEDAMPEPARSAVQPPVPNTSSVMLVPRSRGWIGGVIAALLVAGGGVAVLKYGPLGEHEKPAPNAAVAATPASEQPIIPQNEPQKTVQNEAQRKLQNPLQNSLQNEPQKPLQNEAQNNPQNEPQKIARAKVETAEPEEPPVKAAAPAEPKAPPPAPAPAKKSDVQFTFHVVPKTAQITVDERRVNGEQMALAWRSKPHHVRVVAPGYRPLSFTAPSTASRVFELHLDRAHSAPPPAPAVKPAPKPRPVHDAAPVQEL